IEKGDLRLGSTPINIVGMLNTQPTPAQMDLRLNASDVSIEEMARLAAAAGVAFNPNMQISGKVTANLRAQGTTSQPALDGTLKATGLDISGKELAQPVRVNAIELALTPTEIRSNQFTASTGGTNLNVQLALAGYTTNAPKIDATLQTQNANLGEFLN